MGFSLEYPNIGLHAISRDVSAYPQEHLYVMVNGKLSGEGNSVYTVCINKSIWQSLLSIQEVEKSHPKSLKRSNIGFLDFEAIKNPQMF